MQKIFLAALLIISLQGRAQITPKDSATANPQYDAQLAAKLGGDAYGMKSYYLVMLKTGPNTTTDKDLISESFAGHMRNINKLVASGHLVVAGPLAKNEQQFRGIFIFHNVASPEALQKLLLDDLAIKNGLLAYDVYNWYGSAALPEYLPFSEKIWKDKP